MAAPPAAAPPPPVVFAPPPIVFVKPPAASPPARVRPFVHAKLPKARVTMKTPSALLAAADAVRIASIGSESVPRRVGASKIIGSAPMPPRTPRNGLPAPAMVSAPRLLSATATAVPAGVAASAPMFGDRRPAGQFAADAPSVKIPRPWSPPVRPATAKPAPELFVAPRKPEITPGLPAASPAPRAASPAPGTAPKPFVARELRLGAR